RPLCVGPERSASGTMTLFTSVEALDAAKLEELAALGLSGLRLVVTPLRARAMGVHVDSDTGRATGVSLRVNGETPSELLRLSSSLGVAHAARLEARAATDTEACALAMIRLSGLVPAVIATATEPARVPRLSEALARQAILTVDAEQVRALGAGLDTGIEITHVSDALVPLEEAGNARFMLFRESSGLLEHVAILIGERDTWPEAVPVRLHSACLTGDLFGSLRCDCGEQLRGSLRSFAGNGGGVLLYLQQEGRGIGLGNKLRAYALQEEGLDTVDADRVLGFGADERRYDAAVGILHHLGIRRVKLLTNNPRKVTALERSGIEVLEREPLHGTLNDHNLRYVRAKIQREGHWLNDMLHGAVPGA
ncbi:MAG TPA: GTP cyclohydrolase II, partial [Longimicrobiales bacterium]|nr:GTP cyclohydrolase II [Longimicrobiales bacterium]